MDGPLTLTLIHPASNWTRWVTLLRHPCLAATSASSQVNPIFCRSLFTVVLQFALGRPGPLLYPASTVLAVIYSHHMSKPAKSSCSQFVVHVSLVQFWRSDLHLLSFQEMTSKPLCSSATCGAQHLVSSLMSLSTAVPHLCTVH